MRIRLLIAVMVFGFVGSAFGQEIAWRHDYAAARKEATETGKPLLLDFGTEDCFFCKKLDATTFRNAAIAAKVRGGFIAVKVDGHQHQELARKLDVSGFPTLFLASPDGRVLARQDGYCDAATMGAFLAKADGLRRAPVAAAATSPIVQAKAEFTSNKMLACLRLCREIERSGGADAVEARRLADRIVNSPDSWQRVCEELNAQIDDLYPAVANGLKR